MQPFMAEWKQGSVFLKGLKNLQAERGQIQDYQRLDKTSRNTGLKRQLSLDLQTDQNILFLFENEKHEQLWLNNLYF